MVRNKGSDNVLGKHAHPPDSDDTVVLDPTEKVSVCVGERDVDPAVPYGHIPANDDALIKKPKSGHNKNTTVNLESAALHKDRFGMTPSSANAAFRNKSTCCDPST